MTVNLPQRTQAQGPVKWCKRCSRRHPARSGCELSLIATTTDDGRPQVWSKPERFEIVGVIHPGTPAATT